MAQPAILAASHQMTVDAYQAQHVAADSPPIGPAFALIGLYLTIERGMGGPQVRHAHGFLASLRREWPVFYPPRFTWPVTVLDVAESLEAEAHLAAVQRWGASVWEAWGTDREQVRSLSDDLLRRWLSGRT